MSRFSLRIVTFVAALIPCKNNPSMLEDQGRIERETHGLQNSGSTAVREGRDIQQRREGGVGCWMFAVKPQVFSGRTNQKNDELTQPVTATPYFPQDDTLEVFAPPRHECLDAPASSRYITASQHHSTTGGDNNT